MMAATVTTITDVSDSRKLKLIKLKKKKKLQLNYVSSEYLKSVLHEKKCPDQKFPFSV